MPALLEQPARGAVGIGVLPHTPERPHLGRLGLPPAVLHLADGRLDRCRVGVGEPQNDARDDLARRRRSSADTSFRAAAGPPVRCPSAPLTVALSTTSRISLPYAPAFIRTAPPAVPGIAHPNSIPASPQPWQRLTTTASGAPPATHNTIVITRHGGQLTTELHDHPVPARVGDQQVRSQAHDRDVQVARSRAHPSASARSVSDAGLANHRAGPPVPTVVSRAIG